MADATIDLAVDVAGQAAGTSSAISIEVTASVAADLPGLKLAIDRLRASVSLGLAVSGGRLGLAPPVLHVAPPAGMGAELDLPGLAGGGYLAHVGNEWRGALSSELGPVSVSGFGILGTDPFSFLVLLAAEFTPPIQLSFGFTLVGVGGMVGINRRPDTTALSAAVSSGDLSKLLFPSDPAAQAPHLLEVLSSCFPFSAGSFVVGPMVKLGWGTPTLVAATIGVLVSDAGVVILGRIAITLPFEDAALIRLEALVLGTIDDNGLAIDASLANSQIVGIPVEGDIRLRIRGGSDALFAFSAGGFHPAFPVPDGMGGMRRIGAEISPGPILRARLQAYLAVTTSSVQFGTHAELEAGIAGFGIKGHLDFDALIILDPFGFQADFSAGVSVECADFEVGSINLEGHFSGPTPWRVRGHASFSVLWWDIDVDVPEITWGSSNPPPLPAARDPFAVLLHELAVPGNWAATSGDVPHVVQLRPAIADDHTAVHPLAEIGFRQAAVPLGIDLRRMDGVPLGNAVTLRVRNDGGPALQMRPVQFVPSQFVDLDDRAKLASAGYAQFDGGFDLQPAGFRMGAHPIGRDEEYETSVIGKDEILVRIRASRLVAGVRSIAGHTQVEPAPPTPFVTVRDPGVAVFASTHDLADAAAGVAAGVASAAAARGDSALAAAGWGAVAAMQAGVAERVLGRMSAADPDAGAAVQVARAWEVGV